MRKTITERQNRLLDAAKTLARSGAFRGAAEIGIVLSRDSDFEVVADWFADDLFLSQLDGLCAEAIAKNRKHVCPLDLKASAAPPP
jgi:hypothetical protein